MNYSSFLILGVLLLARTQSTCWQVYSFSIRYYYIRGKNVNANLLKKLRHYYYYSRIFIRVACKKKNISDIRPLTVKERKVKKNAQVLMMYTFNRLKTYVIMKHFSIFLIFTLIFCVYVYNDILWKTWFLKKCHLVNKKYIENDFSR